MSETISTTIPQDIRLGDLDPQTVNQDYGLDEEHTINPPIIITEEETQDLIENPKDTINLQDLDECNEPNLLQPLKLATSSKHKDFVIRGYHSLYQDNQSAILLEKNGCKLSSKKTKHIDSQFYFITNCINKNELSVECCPTKEMAGYIFTKPLQKANSFTTFANSSWACREWFSRTLGIAGMCWNIMILSMSESIRWLCVFSSTFMIQPNLSRLNDLSTLHTIYCTNSHIYWIHTSMVFFTFHKRSQTMISLLFNNLLVFVSNIHNFLQHHHHQLFQLNKQFIVWLLVLEWLTPLILVLS